MYNNQKKVFLNNLNPQDMDDGKEDVNILDLAASEVTIISSVCSTRTNSKEINRKFGE